MALLTWKIPKKKDLLSSNIIIVHTSHLNTGLKSFFSNQVKFHNNIKQNKTIQNKKQAIRERKKLKQVRIWLSESHSPSQQKPVDVVHSHGATLISVFCILPSDKTTNRHRLSLNYTTNQMVEMSQYTILNPVMMFHRITWSFFLFSRAALQAQQYTLRAAL